MTLRSDKNTLQDLIDSDDELPDSYIEDEELPAYMNDDRFDIEYLQRSTISDNGTLLIQGVLSNQDILCVKSIASTASDDYLVWFIKYLTIKDMHSKYSFLRSCLVGELWNTNLFPVLSVPSVQVPKYKYLINVKQ